jgi:hypothetical protein
MATAASLEWQRRFPSRAVRRFSWSLVIGGALAAISWVMFGAEPDRLSSGAANPLALVPPVATVLALLVAAGLLLMVARRPRVAADHYALTVRPGGLRTLLLPWATVAEVAGVAVRGEPLLLVRCATARTRLGDRPRWCDRGVLRASGAAVAGFHLAVRMDEFAGSPRAQLAALAAWVPDQVQVTDQL